MKEKTCCFTGHRNLTKDEIKVLKPLLRTEIEKLINKGVMYFGTGGDTLAAQTILDMKKHMSTSNSF